MGDTYKKYTHDQREGIIVENRVREARATIPAINPAHCTLEKNNTFIHLGLLMEV